MTFNRLFIFLYPALCITLYILRLDLIIAFCSSLNKVTIDETVSYTSSLNQRYAKICTPLLKEIFTGSKSSSNHLSYSKSVYETVLSASGDSILLM